MKKYELLKDDFKFIGETKLYRIKALIDIPRYGVKAGDLGGYIEKEENLSHLGNCWVSGNAKVSGNACVYDNTRVYGDACVSDDACVYGDAYVSGCCSKTPICLSGFKYPVTICDDVMTIGCQTHTIEKWMEFTKEDIEEIGGMSSVKEWEKNKNILFSIIDSRK